MPLLSLMQTSMRHRLILYQTMSGLAQNIFKKCTRRRSVHRSRRCHRKDKRKLGILISAMICAAHNATTTVSTMNKFSPLQRSL